MEKRHLSRRFLASSLDIILINFAILVTIAFLHFFISTQVVLPPLWQSRVCNSIEPLSDKNMPTEGFAAQNLEELLPLGTGESYGLQYCTTTTMGLTSYTELRFVTYSGAEKTITSTYTNYFLNKDGDVVFIYLPGTPQSVIPLWLFLSVYILLFLSVLLKTTPGKKITGLKTVTRSNTPPKRKSLLCRELYKLLPFIILLLACIIVLPAGLHLVPITVLEKIIADPTLVFSLKPIPTIIMLGVYVGIPFLFFWYIFGSFIRWKGATYWDRCAKTLVVRTRVPLNPT